MKDSQRPFKQVDVFTANPFRGNPVAVILDGNGLSTGEMQAISNWTNLSETTFVCVPGDPRADYRLRIFTPKSEIPFAGHPTLGSAWALLESGMIPKTPGRLVQECGKGLVDITISGQKLFFELPEPLISEQDEIQIEAAASALKLERGEIISGSAVDVGPVWLTLQLASAIKVTALKPDMNLISRMEGITGITVFGPIDENSIEVRSFAPAFGVPEDPVCGSGNGAAAALIRLHTLLPSPYAAFQGRCLGRDGRIEVEYGKESIRVGGNAVTCIEGRINVSGKRP